MDPLSIAVGTVGVADVAVRLISYLNSLREDSSKIQDEITILTQEVKALAGANESVEDLSHLWRDTSGLASPFDDGSIGDKVWRNLASVLHQSQDAISKLEILLKEILGKKKESIVTGKIDGLRKTIRKQGRDGEYMELRQRLGNYQNGIQMLLNTLNLYYMRQSHSAKDLALGNLSDDLRRQNTKLQIRMSNLRQGLRGSVDADDLHDSLVSASAVASLISLNEHFDIPQNVSSYYTGRREHLEKLGTILNLGELRQRQTHQKRFVIFGLGGSGKTQFCCKFAQDNRDYFWGVFWIDGSSVQSAQHTYANIAKMGGVEPNELGAKNWLSGLQQPYLLLIDNADDPDIDVTRYFPGGERGVILITTRNPSNKRHGTEGPRFFHFDKLETHEASDLLLAAAVFPRPWEGLTRKHADRIAHVLGYLPLALIHAGKAILDKLCSLSDYPEYYERTWSRIRNTRSRSLSRGQDDEKASSLSVYSSYEMIYVGLESKRDQRSRDALELLKMFSFFYRENIEFDFLKIAAMNPRREREDAQAKEGTTVAALADLRTKTWTRSLYDWAFSVLEQLTRPSTVLPSVLRDEDSIPFDEDRLRSALSLLVRLGMVTLHDEQSSYWMHPLVHTWVRRRPGTSTAEQAIWCQVAATVLAQSILFQAPRSHTAANERLKRQILPHVESVRRLQGETGARLQQNQRVITRPWPLILSSGKGLQRYQAAEFAKFSLVYLHCGWWAKAEELQLQVKDYIFEKAGPESKYGIDIALLLSMNYTLQTRFNEARLLQMEVLRCAKNYYGPDHPTTLQIMDTLGSTCLLCSRLKEASELHQEVVEQFSALSKFGPEHEHTWTAVDNLSKVKARYFEFDEAFKLQRQAYEGLRRVLGPTHQKTLEAQDNLAGIYGFIGQEHLPGALLLSEEVTEIRTKELGREHPLTLKSKLTVAKIKTALDQFEDAEDIFIEGLAAAERNLGEAHLGTLTARTWFGHLHWRQGRYAEAAAIWEDVIEKQNYDLTKRADGEHTDRVQAMWFLIHCYEDEGKIGAALKLCEELTQLVRDFGGEGLGQKHKLFVDVEQKTLELRELDKRHLGEKDVKTHGPEDEMEGAMPGSPASAPLSPVPTKRIIKNLTF